MSKTLALSTLLAGFIFSPAAAQTTSAPQQAGANAVQDGTSSTDTRDRITISPYLWGPGIEGTTTLGSIGAPIDVDLGELASGIQSGGMGHIQYERGSEFVYAEGIFANFRDREFEAFGNQDVRASALLLESGVGTVRELPISSRTKIAFSPYVGIRYVRITASVSGAINLEGKNHWVDPVAGLTARLPLDDNWAILAKADLGGFVLSDNEYQSYAIGVEHSVTDRLALAAGYRSVTGDFNADRGLEIDLRGNGPVISLRYRLGN